MCEWEGGRGGKCEREREREREREWENQNEREAMNQDMIS